MATKKQRASKSKPRRTSIGEGWRTTDADEIECRRRRAELEDLRVRAEVADSAFFGAYAVRSRAERSSIGWSCAPWSNPSTPAIVRTTRSTASAPANTSKRSANICDTNGDRRNAADRRHLLADVAAGKQNLDALRYPLYAYQQEGMLHLAFNGRAILADEMGLPSSPPNVVISCFF